MPPWMWPVILWMWPISGLGSIASLIMLAFGLWWLHRAEAAARARGEHYRDATVDVAGDTVDVADLGSWEHRLLDHARFRPLVAPSRGSRGASTGRALSRCHRGCGR